MKINTILLTLSLFVLASCATVHKNGYHQTKRYKVGHISHKKKKKSSKDKEIVFKTKNSAKEIASNEVKHDSAKFTLLSSKIKEVPQEEAAKFSTQKSIPPAKASSLHKVVKRLKEDIAFARNDLKDEPQEEPTEKEYNIPSVVASSFMFLGILASIGGGLTSAPILALLLFLSGIAAIVLAFIGWKAYKRDREKFKGKFFIYFAYVYAWVEIILVVLLIALLALVLSQA